jgi:lipoyl(octanoyl) transferase
MLPSMQWHFLESAPDDAASNMARDEALMQWTAATGNAAFRVYGWASPTMSLGRNQKARDHYNLDRARARGVGIVRRPTGGRALLHHREITYCATLPARDAAEARAAYDFINGVLLDALARLGAPAMLAGHARGSTVAPEHRPCFDAPWRHGGALLQHGSILIRDDQHWIAELLREPRSSNGSPGAATLADALGREPALDECAAALRRSLGAASPGVRDFVATTLLEEGAARLRARYLDDAWTWRR